MLAIVIFPHAALATPVNKVKLKTANEESTIFLIIFIIFLLIVYNN
jgi:hypothetical protein